MESHSLWRRWPLALLGVSALALVACGAAATATPAANPTAVPAQPTPTAVIAPTVTPAPANIVSAKDTVRLVIDSEPITMNPMGTTAGLGAAVNVDNFVDPFTWQSGDDLRIVPTSGISGWKQLSSTRWQFNLRQGVKFHNGEPWNAKAMLPSLAFEGVGSTQNRVFAYTGGITGEVMDEYTLDLICASACPILSNTSFFLTAVAPNWWTSASDEEKIRNAIGFGPYKLKEWKSGISVTEEAYQDYVPAGDHFEMQKPRIKNLIWQWRGEPTVIAAMIKAGEADMGWDIGVDTAASLPKPMVRSGGSAEIFVLRPNALWHPELKKKEVRQAIMHAINCKEIVDALYNGATKCRGNIIWPGVIGATEANTAPYEYNPAKARQLLATAKYNPENVITITGRGTRIPKQVELYESVASYLKEVGINVKVNVIDNTVWGKTRACGIGTAANDVLKASGRDPAKDKPTMEDFIAAKAKGGASCPQADFTDDAPSNETLDFGRQLNRYMTCIDVRSTFCDPSPGGVQEGIAAALGASGADRQRLLQKYADLHREEVVHVPFFEMAVFYAVDPKLTFAPRFDRRVRVNSMWFAR